MRDKEKLIRWKKKPVVGRRNIKTTLLHAAERLKVDFSCFCTLQKGYKLIFHASARCRKTKKRFFMLLHTAERQKVDFSRFCTLQKDKKEVFHAFAHCRKAKKKFFTLLHTAERQKRNIIRKKVLKFNYH